MDNSSIKAVASCLKYEEIDAKRFVFKFGTKGEEFFFLVRGLVEI